MTARTEAAPLPGREVEEASSLPAAVGASNRPSGESSGICKPPHNSHWSGHRLAISGTFQTANGSSLLGTGQPFAIGRKASAATRCRVA